MCHVLIIEDESIIAEILAELVREAGATSIAMAMTQAEAIQAARAQPPGIILSDVQIRAGTGPLAVQAITAEIGAIPVIFITGTPEECHPRDASAVVLSKPVDTPQLMATFQRMAHLS